MIRDATPTDLPLIRDILRRANQAPYDIGPVLEEKCFGRGARGEPRVRLFAEAGVAVTCGRHLRLIAVAPDSRRQGIGTELLADSKAKVVAAEAGNYFTPGVVDSDGGTIAFFKARGFRETAATWNLHADVVEGAGGASGIRTGVSDDLVAFVRREFGSIWAFEVSRARNAFWIDGVGFAVVEANNRGLGTFGPAGVAAKERGKGHGRALLLAALADLGRLGYAQAVIPWTDAFEFYRTSCGAKPAHRFVTLSLP